VSERPGIMIYCRAGRNDWCLLIGFIRLKFKSCGRLLRLLHANGFLLSMLMMASSVLHKMLFGDFRDSASLKGAAQLEDVDGRVFGTCGTGRKCVRTRSLPA
jgi:hypothetical protein